MKKTLINALFAATLAAIAGTAAADSGRISFEGEITESACSIGGGQLGSNMTVSMGSISTNMFSGVGVRGPKQDFTISLLGCDISVATTASISFAPGAGSVVASRLLGLENASGARGVAVGLEQDGTDIIVGGAAKSYTLQEGTNNLNFKAFYEATDANVTAGAANARAVFEVTYS
ncbi:S-fimbrial protein subunit SfaA precursor [compost metagenome]|uniref:fimbrial protein n=1 Tax=Achromobacter sp. Root83 TaxID=1736602 RepID=UPI00071119FE|nr:fimbrial protein [Achromobacter sp. Root83]KRC72970.1 pilus assembly protein [Achromobacter sp. Root83]